MRVASPVFAALLAVSLSGCGGDAELGGSDDRVPATDVTILAVNPNVGRAVFRLSCRPAGGDVPSPERACAAVDSAPQLLTRPEPFTCVGGRFSWWELSVSGRLDGRPVESRVSTCWTPQMELVGRLGIAAVLEAHLLPRRREEVLAGGPRTIPAGILLPGDVVACEIDGRRLEQGVPIHVEAGVETGYGGVGVRSVALRLIRHRDGSVTARCG